MRGHTEIAAVEVMTQQHAALVPAAEASQVVGQQTIDSLRHASPPSPTRDNVRQVFDCRQSVIHSYANVAISQKRCIVLGVADADRVMVRKF